MAKRLLRTYAKRMLQQEKICGDLRSDVEKMQLSRLPKWDDSLGACTAWGYAALVVMEGRNRNCVPISSSTLSGRKRPRVG
jgi:hypothetical protein